MNRTRLVAMAVLVPAVVAVVAVLITAVAGTATLSVSGVSAGSSMDGFRQDGSNRGWYSAPFRHERGSRYLGPRRPHGLATSVGSVPAIRS